MIEPRKLRVFRYGSGEPVPAGVEAMRLAGKCIVVLEGKQKDLAALRLHVVHWLASMDWQDERPPPERPPPRAG